MKTIKITEEDAKRVLAELVAEKGEDYVYVDPNGIPAHKWEDMPNSPLATCVNTYLADTGVYPSCIVGHALVRLGVPAIDLHTWAEKENVEEVAEIFSPGNLDVEDSDIALEFDDVALAILEEAQGLQDRGVPWGDAVKRAIESLS